MRRVITRTRNVRGINPLNLGMQYLYNNKNYHPIKSFILHYNSISHYKEKQPYLLIVWYSILCIYFNEWDICLLSSLSFQLNFSQNPSCFIPNLHLHRLSCNIRIHCSAKIQFGIRYRILKSWSEIPSSIWYMLHVQFCKLFEPSEKWIWSLQFLHSYYLTITWIGI